MIDNFQRFGDHVMFDITYHLVRERKFNSEENKSRKYGLGLFLGKN